jgi:tripartite-type tricarboxylate transporter receptor subunit TctC
MSDQEMTSSRSKFSICRRVFLKRSTAAATLAVAPIATGPLSIAATRSAHAQDPWPARFVTFIVPNIAGGFTDIIGRMTADFFTKKFRQSFVVDNRAGASGVVGTGYVANSQPDGYTILITSAPQVVILPLLQKVSFNPDNLVPVSNLVSFPYLLAIRASLPIKTLQDFIAYGKANPGKLNYSSAGVGSGSHMVMATFLNHVGIDAVHIPYKSANPAVAAVASDQVDMIFVSAAELAQILSSDRIRVIATAAGKRLPRFPDAPSLSEYYPGLLDWYDAWNGLMAPRGTPQPILDQLTQASQELVRSPDFLSRISSLNMIPLGTTQAEFAERLNKDKAFLPSAIKAAGLKSER